MKKSTLIAVIAILLIGGVGYFVYLKSSSSHSSGSSEIVDENADSVIEHPEQRERFGGNRYAEIAPMIEDQYQKAVTENKTLILAGASEDSKRVYYFTASNEPQNALWGFETSVYVYTEDSVAPRLIKHFYGGVLDMYPEKNLALYMVVDPELLKQSIILASLDTDDETILYQKQLTESDGDIAEGPRIQGTIYFETAIINSSGTKVVISTLGPDSARSKELGAIAEIDLMTGTIDVLDDLVGEATPQLWEDDDTIILTRYLDDGDQETFSYSF